MGKKKRKKKTTTPGAKQSFSKKEFQYLKECTEKSILAAFEKYKLISIQQEMHPEKNRVEVVAITTEEGKHLLLIGNETIEILNYMAKSSSDGATELFVTIKGDSVSTELSANLEE